ncbi:MAG: transporter substrate-binding domain-containing protein, partial [Proteobacteria bacterium]|nr:transporter substrate-binding domain-containing protein [Pseudomonadota bacterium]
MPDVELKLYGTQDEVYLDLTAGRIDAAFADSIAMSDGFLNTDAGKGYAFFGRDYLEVKYFGVGAGIAVRKGEEDLRDAFSAAIQAIRDSGEYKAINDKYFAVDIFGG